jgi:membrane-associated phospholipid phosphatase
VNSAVATHDAVEDPVTAAAPLVVPAFAVATVALWFLARPYGALRWKLASVSALGAAGLALLANRAIASAWDRPRPFVAHPAATHLLAARTADPSFPSDHAAAAAAIAAGVLAFSLEAGLAFAVAAVLVAVSRVALGVHYPSDVLAGLAVGAVSGLLVVTVGRDPVRRVVTVLSRVSDPVVARARYGLRHR